MDPDAQNKIKTDPDPLLNICTEVSRERNTDFTTT